MQSFQSVLDAIVDGVDISLQTVSMKGTTALMLFLSVVLVVSNLKTTNH
jgi:hypothetical protein